MKKLLKRIMALSLCACMMMGAASPASAAAFENTSTRAASQKINISRFDNACMNVYGNNTISNNRNVCIYTNDGTAAQRWEFENIGGQVNYVKSALNTRYALNVDRRSGQNWNCTVYELSGNEPDASITVNKHWATGEFYDTAEFTLTNYPDMLLKADVEATRYSDTANIHWISMSASTDDDINLFRYHWDI